MLTKIFLNFLVDSLTILYFSLVVSFPTKQTTKNQYTRIKFIYALFYSIRYVTKLPLRVELDVLTVN